VIFLARNREHRAPHQSIPSVMTQDVIWWTITHHVSALALFHFITGAGSFIGWLWWSSLRRVFTVNNTTMYH
jgi:hypothetical protein